MTDEQIRNLAAELFRDRIRLHHEDASASPSLDQAASASENGGRTGYPPGLLQDDSSALSKVLSRDPNARQLAREAAASAVGEELANWEDERVQKVYSILCDTETEPPEGHHWEGFQARRIVAALQPPAAGDDELEKSKKLDGICRDTLMRFIDAVDEDGELGTSGVVCLMAHAAALYFFTQNASMVSLDRALSQVKACALQSYADFLASEVDLSDEEGA